MCAKCSVNLLIRELQYSVILLFFHIVKIRNIGFAGNLFLNSSRFYYDDVTATSFTSIKYGDVMNMNVATEIFP